MIFTRYLYNADEVCYTFLECLIKNKSLDECYFWIYEYFSSGFKELTLSTNSLIPFITSLVREAL